MIIEKQEDESGKIILDIIKNKDNFFIGRMPGIEANTINQYIVSGKVDAYYKNAIQQNTGFYCNGNDTDFYKILKEFCNIYLLSLRKCDLLYRVTDYPHWDHLVNEHREKIYKFSCALLHYWLPALEGKKILVISPFEKSIKMQFPKRKHLFTTWNNKIIKDKKKSNYFEYPEFDLVTLNCPNTIKGNDPFPHNNWLETLKDMCKKIDKLDFDIAVLGCGSYGMPLAHYIKKIGKSSIYAGSYTQVMFGIKGKRWENAIGGPPRVYWNEHWKWPEESEVPKSANEVEGGCYWK